MTTKNIIGKPRIRNYEIGDMEELLRRADSYVEPSEEKVKKQNKIVNPPQKAEPINFDLNINKSDYVQIPGQNFVTAIAETDFNLNYEEVHKAILKRGLNSHNPLEFMMFHNYIIDCYKNKKPVFDASANKIPDKIRDDLYKQLTSKCWTWLNGKFDTLNNKNKIEYITGIDSNNNLLTRTEDLEDCLMEDKYIDFNKLTKDGLASVDSISLNQNYSKGDNIYFWYPRKGFVAVFDAGSGGADLVCGRNPSNRYSSLGVRAKAQLGNQGSLGGVK